MPTITQCLPEISEHCWKFCEYFRKCIIPVTTSQKQWAVFSFDELLTSLLKFGFKALPHPCKKNEDCNERATCHRGKCQCVGKTTGNGKNCRGNMVKRNIVYSTDSASRLEAFNQGRAQRQKKKKKSSG